MKFRPDAVIPIHDHQRYAGAVLLVEGEVRARNFDVVEGSRESSAVRVQETSDVLLLPGRFSTLATGRHNLHELRAGPQGARAIDVFTFFEGAQGSRYLDLDEDAPLDAARRVFAARWR
jgi:single-stranded DNA-binding protein